MILQAIVIDQSTIGCNRSPPSLSLSLDLEYTDPRVIPIILITTVHFTLIICLAVGEEESVGPRARCDRIDCRDLD
jgi:hypothetical protein